MCLMFIFFCGCYYFGDWLLLPGPCKTRFQKSVHGDRGTLSLLMLLLQRRLQARG